jgi:tRNA(Arg) A34 adenosine deaminase TadA
MNRLNQVLLVCLCLFTTLPSLAVEPSTVAPESVTPVQAEKDEILSLAVLDMIYKDWQSDKKGRGHNIGSILVDKNSTPVFWARNSIRVLNNATQHGEVRLIQAFLECPGIGNTMNGYAVYTTLEPCAMCTGMLSMTQIDRVVFVQDDPEYGHTLHALEMIKFPRLFAQATPEALEQKKALDAQWIAYRTKHPGASITDYLVTDEARQIYASAENALRHYVVKFPENQIVLTKTLDFLKGVGEETYGQKMLEKCPVP